MAKSLGRPAESEWGPNPAGEYGYPYDTWFNGEMWHLTQGVDFKTEPKAFRGTVRSAAKYRGLKLRTRVVGANFYLQAFKP